MTSVSVQAPPAVSVVTDGPASVKDSKSSLRLQMSERDHWAVEKLNARTLFLFHPKISISQGSPFKSSASCKDNLVNLVP